MFHGFWVSATRLLGDRFGVYRTLNGLTNNWNRWGRELFGMDERKSENVRNHNLSTSALPSQKRKLESNSSASQPKKQKNDKSGDDSEVLASKAKKKGKPGKATKASEPKKKKVTYIKIEEDDEEED
jgi:hypothetical protein